jgi:hypothetical protein
VAEPPQSTTFRTIRRFFHLFANFGLDRDGHRRRHKGDAMRRQIESDVDTTPFMEWLAVLSSIVMAVLVFAAYSQMAS